MSGQVENTVYHPIGKLYVGMTKESIRTDIDAMTFKSGQEREKAYNKQIQLFDYVNNLVLEEVDDFISEKEIEAYNKKEKKKKIWKTIGLVALGIGALVGGRIIAKKLCSNAGKIKTVNAEALLRQPKSTLQILEEFKPAEKIEEAKLRAIKDYGLKGFEMTDLGCANDALYTLELIKSKSTAPLGITKIIEVPIINNNPNIMGTMCPETGIMHISLYGMKYVACSRITSMAQQVPIDKLKEYQELMIKMGDNGNIPMFQLTKDFIKLGIKPSCISDLPFQTLIHEQGHRAHLLVLEDKNLYWKMGKLNEIKEAGIKDFSIYNEFMSDKIQDIIKSCPFLGDYARTSPCEFVAEVYSALINDIKLPENIMELYRKYHGPVVL